jgi:predicted Zn-dependent peptidase
MLDELKPGPSRTATRPSSTGITYEHYTGPNGLDVILHEDHKAPIVHVMVWYHVGSKDESYDMTGFAHLFEHMMFQGSENVGKTEHFAYVQGVGGSLNATTGQDRTNYFQTVPREYIGLALWLEADRMRSLKVTHENFQNQLSVVKEERKQRYDNAPYGLWYLVILDMLFGGSVYGWSPIGDMAHLDAAPLDAVQAFHRAFYVPNNATVVVAGDFEGDEARAMIDEFFGAIPAGVAVARPRVEVRPLVEQSRRTLEASVPLPAVYLGFQSAPVGHPDARALSVLALILNRGRSSRLQRSLVYGSQIAQSVAAFNIDMEHAGLFVMLATASDDATAEQVERQMWEQIDQIRRDGVEARELEAALNHIRTSFVTSVSRLQGVADALAYYHVLCGDASRINGLLDDYAAITVADIQRVADRYLRSEAAAVLLYRPIP